MQAIGQEILRQNPKARVIYAPGEQFTNEIIDGIRTKNTKDFKEKYRSASALLIDDIQFLSGKDTVQEEFFYTFNAIQQNEGQIILTSDRKPSDIKDLADRLRSPFWRGFSRWHIHTWPWIKNRYLCNESQEKGTRTIQ